MDRSTVFVEKTTNLLYLISDDGDVYEEDDVAFVEEEEPKALFGNC